MSPTAKITSRQGQSFQRLMKKSRMVMKFDTYGKKKVVMVAYRSDSLQELLITKFKSQFKQGLMKVAVTRAGHS